MDDAAVESDRGAGPLPELPEVADRLPVAVEDVRTVEPAGLPTPLDHGRQLANQRQDPAVLLSADGSQAE